MFEYLEKINTLVHKLATTQRKQLLEASRLVANVIENDKIVHTLGTGHSQMVAMELFGRASNIANVNAIMDDMVLLAGGARKSAEVEQISGLAELLWDKYTFDRSDLIIIISNSGRNAIPIEMALKAKEMGLTVIAITSLAQSKKYPSRHASGKKLYELADLVIDNCVPSGDGVLTIGNKQIGPASSILGIMIMNMISAEAVKLSTESGVDAQVFQSQNIDGSENEAIYQRFESRIKHF
ncbi:sugar isomerase domain-containing protein [Spongiimicrobium sp. 3-5]|uniref:sugar isomerase domain-containing protein n=1 Tax=Spongiimicrobium sp. 3-5 TaxID=3332596 RepID=UPI0039805FAE